jgi:hypothetical protein
VTSTKRPLPGPQRLVEALGWLRSGAPVQGGEIHLRTLHALINALPSHLPQYARGTPEWREAVRRESEET